MRLTGTWEAAESAQSAEHFAFGHRPDMNTGGLNAFQHLQGRPVRSRNNRFQQRQLDALLFEGSKLRTG